MPDYPTCPWCGAPSRRWNLANDRGEWFCGSYKAGREATQVLECRNNVLESEVEQLRCIVEPLNRLRAVEGVDVTFCAPNEKFSPDVEVVTVLARWHGGEWQERNFAGPTLAECLAKAVAELEKSND